MRFGAFGRVDHVTLVGAMETSQAGRLPWLTRSAYSVGHVLNDLTAAAWFSYLIVYYQAVRGLSASHAGVLLFVGQGVDAVMTPTVGVLSDRFTDLPYGQRKSWHLFGTVLVAISFPFVFGSDFGFVNRFSTTSLLIWSCTFVAAFQIAWASTQVAHLSLIPELTSNSRERDFLNSARYAFTIVSSVAVFVLAFGLLESSSGRELGPGDMFHFALLSYLLVGIGLVAAIYFHMGVAEPSHADKQAACGKAPGHVVVVWSDWFKRLLFYQVGGVYMCARIVVNVSQIYLPLFLLDTLNMNKTNIAVAPLAVFISGLAATSIQKPVNNAIGRRMTLLVGIVISVGTCAGAQFVSSSSPYIVYAVVAGLGVGGTTMLVTALAMEADLIGDDVEGSAFVYGALSFLDKLSNGIAVLIIQFMAEARSSSTVAGPDGTHHARTDDDGPDPALAPFYRTVMVYVPGFAAIACGAFMATTYFFGGYSEYSKRVRPAPPSTPAGHDPSRPLLYSASTASLSSPSGRDSPSDRYADANSPRVSSYGSINDLNAQYNSAPPGVYVRRNPPLGPPVDPLGASPDPTRIFFATDTGDLLRTWSAPDDDRSPGAVPDAPTGTRPAAPTTAPAAAEPPVSAASSGATQGELPTPPPATSLPPASTPLAPTPPPTSTT